MDDGTSPADPSAADPGAADPGANAREDAKRQATRLDTAQVRWQCDATRLPFQTTRDVEPATGVVGQDAAVEALYFGLESTAQGQNVFVRGLTGTGRMTLIRQLSLL